MVGAITALVGVAKLGFVADLISKPTMIGYMNGLALTILVGQLPKLFGFSVDADGFIGELQASCKGVAAARRCRPRWPSGVGLVLILALQRFLPKVPAVLVVVVLSIVAASVFELEQHGVSVVGPLPQGFPPLTIPDVALSDIPVLLGGRGGHRGRLAGRHDLDRVGVRGAQRAGRRRQPGDDRHRGRQLRGRACSRGSRSARAAPARRWPSRPGRRRRSPGWWARPRSR